MTAAEHLATYEAAGPAAVHAHLQTEHANQARALFGVSLADVNFYVPAEVHRLLHADDQDGAA